MKKVLLSMAVVAFLAACGGGASADTSATDSTDVSADTTVVEEAPAADTTAATADTTAAVAAEATPAV